MRVEWAIADYSTTCIREDIRELRSLENLTLSNKIEFSLRILSLGLNDTKTPKVIILYRTSATISTVP